ncbi:MAG: hypothetical protein IIY55_12230, partial [Blautia sp.]|nr:hypothetical protein [Blautia sp.]
LTVAIMLLLGGGLLFFKINVGEYSLLKAADVFLLILIYAVEAVEDVVWGKYRHDGYLQVGAKLFFFRWAGIMAVFAAGMVLLRSMEKALFASFLVSIGIFVLMTFFSWRMLYGKEKEVSRSSARKENLPVLAGEVFPLALINFLTFYLSNAPKYALDGKVEDSVQACFGFVMMPVFVINLFSTFLYQLTLVDLSVYWREHDRKKIRQNVRRQFLYIGGLTAAVLLGGYFAGIPVLSALYATNLKAYKRELLLLLLAGGFLAMQAYLRTVLTVMRRQRITEVVYIIAALLSLVLLPGAIKNAGTCGGAVCFAALMGFLTAGLFLIYGRTMSSIKAAGRDQEQHR